MPPFPTSPWSFAGLAARLLLPVAALTVGVGCAGQLNRATVDKVFTRAATVPDLQRGCTIGEALGLPMESLTHPDNPPRKATILSDASAALCAEIDAREPQLQAARARVLFSELPVEVMIAQIQDAREHETRARHLAAKRYMRAWQDFEILYGPIGADSCPRIKRKDEIVYLMGLNAGLNGLLNDRASGGSVGFPLDVLNRVARASHCIDDADWWHVPQAMRAAAWATVPGSGPEGTDPWELLDEAAAQGELGGIRLARAVQVVIAANSGREDVVADGIRAFSKSLNETPTDPAFALFDDYAHTLVRHEADLIWTRAAGHRALDLSVLPGDDQSDETFDDLFSEDPFADGADPFGAAFDPEGPDESPDEAPQSDEPNDDPAEE